MKKTKRIIISVVVLVLVIAIGVFVYYNYFYDANQLNIKEKEWLDDHKSSVVTFNVPNDLNIFGTSGAGVYYDFLNDFATLRDVKLNDNITPIEGTTGLGFVVSRKIDKDDLLLYQDHYVVVAKNDALITEPSDLNGKTIAGLSEGVSSLSAFNNVNAVFVTADSKSTLLDQFKNDKADYMIVPLNEYIGDILSNGYAIVYHLSEIPVYYYINLGDDIILNNIVTKFYNEWKETKFEKSFYTNSYNLFVDKLSLTQIETDALTNKTFTYGFIKSSPYNTLSSSKYGGIIMSYLSRFSKFSNVEFTYTKYKSDSSLVNAYNNKKVDLVFDSTALKFNDFIVKTNFNNEFYIISPISKNIKLASPDDLVNNNIYVIENSSLHKYLSTFKNLDIKTVSDEKDLFKRTKKDDVIAIDALSYNYFMNDKINDYNISYDGFINTNNAFRYQSDSDAFYKLFSNYVRYLDSNEMISDGLISYKEAEQNGNIVSTIAKYILAIVSFGVVITGLIIASKKQIKLNTKIKKNEKLKFVDVLTSLKNRNYLNEKIDVWNQNEIYPQAIIVIDLNNIKYLNDTFGHEEGDNQIKAAANVLHQTQLDNTEIMRTDGNEFMIYLVGYTEKQVVNYLKKLVKEFNDLPYEYGAAVGFSMIVDDLKLIDDAINEATIHMRENKEIEARDEEKDA